MNKEWLQFSGFMDDEVGKLSNLSEDTYGQILAEEDPLHKLQATPNPTTLDALNQYLLNAAFFLEPQLIVDGWFILTPNWWDSFFEPKVNLLPHMLESKLCVSFTRGGPLSNVGIKSEKQVQSYQRLHDFPKYPLLRSVIGTNFDNKDVIKPIPWPKYDFDDILRNIILAMVTADRAQLGLDDNISLTEDKWHMLKDRFFHNLHERKDSARQAWTRACLTTAKTNNLILDDLRELCALGSHAYHWSRALGMKYDDESEDCSVSTFANDVYDRHAFLPDIGELIRESGDPTISLALDWPTFKAKLEAEQKSGTDTLIKRLAELNSGTGIGAIKSQYIAARKLALEDPRYFGLYYEMCAKYVDEINQVFRVKARVTGDLAKVGDTLIKSVLQRSAIAGVSSMLYSFISKDATAQVSGTMASPLGAYTFMSESFRATAKLEYRDVARVNFDAFRQRLFKVGAPQMCPRQLLKPNEETRKKLFQDVRVYGAG